MGKVEFLKCRAAIIQGGHAHARWIPCSPCSTLHACTTRGFRWIPVHDICSWQACVRNEPSTCSPLSNGTPSLSTLLRERKIFVLLESGRKKEIRFLLFLILSHREPKEKGKIIKNREDKKKSCVPLYDNLIDLEKFERNRRSRRKEDEILDSSSPIRKAEKQGGL